MEYDDRQMGARRSEFVEAVRGSRVPHPTQRRFTLAEWEEAFARIAAPSDGDRRLAEAGRWVFEGLEGVRRNLGQLPTAALPRSEQVRLTAALINYGCAHARSESARLMEAKGGVPDLAIGADVEGLLESIVGGGRYALADAMRTRDTQGRASGASKEEIGSLVRRLDLGMVYDQVEDMWARCLWNDWSIHRTDDVVLCAPEDWDRERDRVVGVTRRDGLLLELVLFAITRWTREPTWLRRMIVSKRRVIGILRNGKRKRLEIGEPGTGMEEIPHEEVAAMLAEEIYLASALQEPLPDLQGLTVRQLLAAWTAVAPLGRIVRERYPTGAFTGAKGQLEQFAPMFDGAEIVRVIRACVGVTVEQAEAVVQLWTFSGVPRDELWVQPFVEVDGGRLVLLDAALVNPNLLRSVEHWLRAGGVDLQARGPLWEAHVRGRLQAECSLPNAEVLARTAKMTSDVGDIDLVLRIGRTLVVGESKCTLFATSAMEEHNYEVVLRDAAEQATIKAAAVRADPASFAAQCEWAADGTGEWQVLPVVVTNLPSGAGRVVDGVPVLDLVLLVRFLSEGAWHRMNRMTPEGDITPVDTVRFYDSQDEAEGALPAYLLDPPQVAYYRDHVRRGYRPVIKIEGGATIAIQTAEVQLPVWAADHGVVEGA